MMALRQPDFAVQVHENVHYTVVRDAPNHEDYVKVVPEVDRWFRENSILAHYNNPIRKLLTVVGSTWFFFDNEEHAAAFKLAWM